MKKLATTADGAIPSSSAPAHHHNNNVENNAKNSNKNDSSAVISPIKVKKPSKIPSSSLSSSVPQSPSNSKLVKFSLLKSKMSNDLASGQQNNKNDHFGCGGRKMSSKSFDSFSCGNATPKIMPKRKLSTKIVLNGNNEGIHGARNNDMMQEIDKLKKGWRKLLCMT
uniref:Uncharacterized protein n=1 Tax=Romanomermis culicivorax TaxID=13658 RepID=A0A915IYY2_ROMCU